MFFESLEHVLARAAEGLRPAERLSVSEAAALYRRLDNKGAYVGPWQNERTPYLVEPMDTLTSREFTGAVFAGPAQCGKTDMFLNWLLYSVICDPADMMLIEKVNTTARDFSIRRIDRLHRHSPEVGSRLIARRDADNTFDKQYLGMMLNLSWPTINELSGRPIPRLWLTDYDRMPEDIDDEGSPFDLARKRTTTFRSHGMTVAESSPGYEITDPKWQRKSAHEAPPTRGILSLFNRGDRRLWYWRCVSCHAAFEPDFSLFSYPQSEDMMESAEQVVMGCPHCGQIYYQQPGVDGPGREEMNISGRWVRDGQIWTPEGAIVGTPLRSDIASWWLKGAAAALVDWKTLVINYLKAEKEYEDTGSETALKTTINVDQGKPYLPKAEANLRVPEELKSRARELGDKVVPFGVRFLIATIDVQKNRFVVQVHGIGEGSDIWIVDRFEIKRSRRRDPDQPDGYFWVNPGAYPEDWKLLVSEVIEKSYPLADGSGRQMAIRFTMCDSGGRAGVTPNAYNFFRWLRRGDGEAEQSGLSIEDDDDYGWKPTLAARFLLLKGDPNENAPRVRIAYPDSQRKDRTAGARGEIPVAMINVDMLKDTLNMRLDRLEPYGGRINFPTWLGHNFYAELCVEIKDIKKGWINPKGYRNESWDLLVYLLAALQLPAIAAEYINWASPDQGWARDWDENDLVFDPQKNDTPFENSKNHGKRLRDLASLLA